MKILSKFLLNFIRAIEHCAIRERKTERINRNKLDFPAFDQLQKIREKTFYLSSSFD